MNKKSLIYSNPYLKNEKDRLRLVTRSVNTSCGVEGIDEKVGENEVFKIPSRGEKKIYRYLSK
jgi:hypothetical protein